MAVYNRVQNGIVFQDGISFNAGLPADDRIVLDYEDLYISSATKTSCPLFNRAYTGMVVTVFEEDGTPTVLVLKSSEPYKDTTLETINAENYKNYWFAPQSTENQGIRDALDALNTSVNNVVGNINTSIVTLNTSTSTAIGNLNTSVNTALGKLNTSLNASINALNTSVVTRFGNLENKIDASFGEFSQSVDTLVNETISAINTSIGNVSTALSELRNDVNSSLDSLQGNVSTLIGTTVSEINSSIADVSAFVHNVNTSTADAVSLLQEYDTSIYVSLENLINTNKALADASLNLLDTSCSDLFEIIFNNELVTAEALIELNNKINRTMASYVAIDDEDYPDADLCIADASNNTIVAFQNGGIITSNFNSETVNSSIADLYNKIDQLLNQNP